QVPSIPGALPSTAGGPRLGIPSILPATPGTDRAKLAEGTGNTAPTLPGESTSRPGAGPNADSPERPSASLAAPVPGSLVPEPRKPATRSAPVRPGLLIPNRDWIIPIECTADGVVITLTGQRIATATVSRGEGGSNPLRDAVQQLIDRHQASV